VAWFETDVQVIRKQLPADAWAEFDQVSTRVRAASKAFGGLDAIRVHQILMCLVGFDIALRLEFELSVKSSSAIFKILSDSFKSLGQQHFYSLRLLTESLILDGNIVFPPTYLTDLMQSHGGLSESESEKLQSQMFYSKDVSDSMKQMGVDSRQLPSDMFVHLCWALSENGLAPGNAASLFHGLIGNNPIAMRELRHKSGATGIHFINSKNPRLQAFLESELDSGDDFT